MQSQLLPGMDWTKWCIQLYWVWWLPRLYLSISQCFSIQQGSCYSVHFNRSSFTAAQSQCQSQGKVLVEITNQQENDLLSELLIQNEYSPGLLSQVWTGGVGPQIQRSAVYYWAGSRTKINGKPENFFDLGGCWGRCTREAHMFRIGVALPASMLHQLLGQKIFWLIF